jgi:hypothetical protein
MAAALLGTMLFIGAPITAHAQTPAATCALHGRVADSLGAAVSKAFVLVHSFRWEEMNQQVKLDENGEFTLQLKPGFYHLFVGYAAFIPYAKVVDLRQCKPLVLKIKLNVDMTQMDD